MKGPRVLVHDDHWREVCEGLTKNGVCTILPKSQVYHIDGQPLLNTLLGVKKDEIVNGVPVHRLIMDLRPCNNVCRGLEGDVATLPSWATMGPLQLMPTEDLVVSSEDVRCFFYIFRVPSAWHPFLAFNKPLPEDMWPGDDGPYYIASQVLTMGFKNSVSLAQHVHRNIVRMASTRTGEGLRPEQEARKDRPFSSSSLLHRIYVDNSAFRGYPPVIKLPIPEGVKLEVARFLCLIPLAKLDFRLGISSEVTASDASTSGCGLTVTTGLTGFGVAASEAATRGDVAEPHDLHGVLTIGLFDGIGALRVASGCVWAAVVGHISVEVNKAASRVLKSKFPATVFVEGGVEAVSEEEVRRCHSRAKE